MRVAVVGGTGLVGRHTVEALKRGNHDTKILARSHGVDLVTAEGIDEALSGVEAVIDVKCRSGRPRGQPAVVWHDDQKPASC